jgi:hypothetical protein
MGFQHPADLRQYFVEFVAGGTSAEVLIGQQLAQLPDRRAELAKSVVVFLLPPPSAN